MTTSLRRPAPAAESVQTPAPYDPGAPPQEVAPDQGTVPSPGGQDLDPPVTQAS